MGQKEEDERVAGRARGGPKGKEGSGAEDVEARREAHEERHEGHEEGHKGHEQGHHQGHEEGQEEAHGKGKEGPMGTERMNATFRAGPHMEEGGTQEGHNDQEEEHK